MVSDRIEASVTVFASVSHLTKDFKPGPDGSIVKGRGVQFASGRAGTFRLRGDSPAHVLALLQGIIETLNAQMALGLGVARSGVEIVDVTTTTQPRPGALARTLENWWFPPGFGIFGVDSDKGQGFNAQAERVYPPWREIATLSRGSVSMGISHPERGVCLIGGEHVYAPIDQLPRCKAAAESLDRLFWAGGFGWVFVAKNGVLYPRSPIDLSTFSPERVIYEVRGRVAPPLVAGPRPCLIRPGRVLSVDDLIAFADSVISAAEVDALFREACRDPAIQAEAVRKAAAWSADRVARGLPPRASAKPATRRSTAGREKFPRPGAKAPVAPPDEPLARVAVALGGSGRPSASGWHSCCCPVHADHRPSLGLARGADGRLLVHCFAGCDPQLIKMNLAARGLAVDGSLDVPTLQHLPSEQDELLKRRLSEAGRLWAETVPLNGTAAEDYLRRVRRIGLDPGPSLRWHVDLNALVAKVVHPFAERAVGVHLTFLDRTTRERRARRFVGQAGLVKFGEGRGRVLIGEGLETTLSGLEIVGASRAYCTLGAAGLARLRLPLGIVEVGILVDRDEAGEAAALAAARRLVVADPARRVRLLRPSPPHADFNDVAVARAGGSHG